MADYKKREGLRAPPGPLVPPFSLRGGIKDLYFYRHSRTEGEYARHLWKIQLLLIALCIAIVYLAYINLGSRAPALAPQVPAGISLSTDKPSYSAGEIMQLRGTSNNCTEDLRIYLDTGEVARMKIARENASFSLNLSSPASPGAHVVHAESGECSASAQISVMERPCAPGETRACRTGAGCEGTTVCTDFGPSECIVNKVCAPGETIQCSYDTCNSGYKVCNQCGTGYGKCMNPNLPA
ncbi:MAG: hypothetical protein AB1468_00445 [Candidatus Micrarchaeota archaeon]